MMELCQPELVFAQLEADSSDQLLETLADTLLKTKRVSSAYPEDLLLAEKRHPSALPMDDPVLALPHASLDYVQETSLVLATLARPVSFISFVDGRRELKSRLVILTAFHEGEREVETLQAISHFYQEKEKRQALLRAEKRDQLWPEVQKLLSYLAFSLTEQG